MQASKSGASRLIHLWTQLSTAHQKFLRVWIIVHEMVREAEAFSHAVNIYMWPNSGHVKFVISLLLSSGLYFLDLSYFFSFCAHCNWSDSLISESMARSRENTATSKGTVTGEPWRASWADSARSPMANRPQCEESQGKLTLEAKANAAAKLKISRVNFRLSQVA